MALMFGIGMPATDIKSVGGIAQTGRDWSSDLRALTDDTVKGILRSLGDAGANPANTTGYTVLSHLNSIRYYSTVISNRIDYPANAETFTTTPLDANATYYGPARDFSSSRLGFMSALAFSDQPSATNGFYIQQSIDGTNWDLVSGATSVSANTGAAIKVAVVARYARVVYVNGDTAQTVFRLGGRYMIA
jgi:hypothetical protein